MLRTSGASGALSGGKCSNRFVFAGSDAGGETLAKAMTIIETAKLSGLDPQAYLADVLARINDHMINKLHEL